MSISLLVMDFVGNSGVPRLGRMISTDNLAGVVAAGYVDQFLKNENMALFATDAIMVSASDGNGWFYPSFGVDHSVTLVAM
jgi:hypothetical protein